MRHGLASRLRTETAALHAEAERAGVIYTSLERGLDRHAATGLVLVLTRLSRRRVRWAIASASVILLAALLCVHLRGARLSSRTSPVS